MQATRRVLQALPSRNVGDGFSVGACRAQQNISASALALAAPRHNALSHQRAPSRPQQLRAAAHSHQQSRTFSISPTHLKKGGKAAREASREAAASAAPTSASSKSSASQSQASAGDDPSDFAALEADIAKCIERLRADLSKLRAGGRFNPEVLEVLRVQLGKKGGSGEGGQVVKLGDVCQVVPKGRTVQIIVGEQEHLKPISSAIQSSTLNLTPQPDPTGANPLLLTLAIPPPTAESRKQAVAAATKAGETASSGIRNARGAQQKKIRAAQVAKTARPDDLKKAGVGMEKVVEKGVGEVKKIVDGAKKALDV